MKTEFVIFDMDGTLVDSELCSAQALVDVLPQNFSIDVTQMLEEFRGVRTANILAVLSERFEPVDAEATIERFRIRENELAAELITLNPGVEPLLDALNGLSLPYCIASNAPVEKTVRSLKLCGIEHYFGDNVFSAYQVNAWKPDPELFLHAAKVQGIAASRCLVVEDSDVGIEAAIAAKMQAVFYNPHNLPVAHAESTNISEYGELLDLIVPS